MDFYSVVKKREVMEFVNKWAKMETIIVNTVN